MERKVDKNFKMKIFHVVHFNKFMNDKKTAAATESNKNNSMQKWRKKKHLKLEETIRKEFSICNLLLHFPNTRAEVKELSYLKNGEKQQRTFLEILKR
jgi:hypothetical protein